ncbi:TRAP transporter substrate-binding protein DctP [Dethiosulfatarculus sandiegensis]|uniref:C4-dicarboxylate ABC transporter substrate-binding protein n=1 Tax=Dethiosulfatarculus sandiegensis TaxID=1429043 RepID=A0A0D2JTP8_9BACT|nr:TRAP transporter substrate-binding protein DctP [Dethiosulfatarculus sandiegensis]KIX12875.1 hypothetical protein X474_16865 [Dethiosulfatarculus sandiegensis]
MKRFLLFLGISACLLMLTASFALAGQKPIRLKMATQYMDRHPVYQFVWKSWIKEIKQRTKGRVIITYYNCNTICPDAEICDAVLKGQVDIGDYYTSRHPGRFPLSTVISKIPMSSSTVLAGSMAFWELWKTTPAIQDEFKGIKIFGMHQTASLQISTKDKPIRKVEDMKGMRLACVGKTSISVAKAFDANTVVQPGPDLYMALSRNMAEGVLYPIPPMRSFKVNEATKYTTLYDFDSGSCWFGMNQAKWDSLPADIKKVFEETTGEAMTRAIALALDKGVERDIAAMKKEGQKFFFPSADEKARAAAILQPVLFKAWLEEVAKSNCSYADPEGIYKKATDLLKKNDALYGRK